MSVSKSFSVLLIQEHLVVVQFNLVYSINKNEVRTNLSFYIGLCQAQHCRDLKHNIEHWPINRLIL